MNSELAKVVEIRGFTASDAKFILATFLTGLYYGDSWLKNIPKDIFMDSYKIIALGLLAHPHTNIQIACLKEDIDTIVGYSILSEDFQSIHWVYVKAAWRKQGIAKALLPKYPTTATHMSELGLVLMKKFEGLIFNPFKEL